MVVERTGGVPLFIEELTRAVLESGSARISGREIPATLHDSLMARLDRLGPAKEVIQIGAVIGSEFSYGLLHAVHPIPDQDLQAAIRSATDAELVYVRGIPPDATYQFKHALIRDAAYEALLRSRRKELHSRIAEVLVRQFPERVTSAPELLAHHYTEAGLIEQAIPCWQNAGQRGVERSANTEAISHFTKALELLKSTADTPERIQQELRLQIAMGAPLIAARGYGAAEVEQVYARARELCTQVGNAPQLVRVMRGLWTFNIQRGRFHDALDLGEQLLGLAQQAQDPPRLIEAYFAMGAPLMHCGEFAQARAQLNRGIALYDPHRHHSPRALQDFGVTSRSYLAMTLWFLGYPDQALHQSNEALALARNLSHAFSQAYALSIAPVVHQLRREGAAAQERAEAATKLSSDQEFINWTTFSTVFRGWALAAQGRTAEGIAQIHCGLTGWQALGSVIAMTVFLGLLADACDMAGQVEQGLEAVMDALALVKQAGERVWEAELYRLKGQLTLQSGLKHNSGNSDTKRPEPGSQPEADAEACFRKAIEIARQQTAKSWELRATMSLARLLAHQGRRDEARTMLAEIYGWFTEGFDTADLKDAKALLDELSR